LRAIVQTRRNRQMFPFCTTTRWLRIVRNQEKLWASARVL
jgi:hypothetical protein